MNEKKLTQEEDFKELNRIVQNLTLHWRHYQILFGTSKKRIDLLNESDSTFFFCIEKLLFEKIQLELVKLILDNKKDNNRNVKEKDENYILKHLAHLAKRKYKNEALAEELYKVHSKLRNICEGANLKDIRHKKIAHNAKNLTEKNIENKLSRGRIKEILKLITDFMNKISKYYDDSETLYFSDDKHPHSLEIVYKLVQASRYNKLLEENSIDYDEDMVKSKYFDDLT